MEQIVSLRSKQWKVDVAKEEVDRGGETGPADRGRIRLRKRRKRTRRRRQGKEAGKAVVIEDCQPGATKKNLQKNASRAKAVLQK